MQVVFPNAPKAVPGITEAPLPGIDRCSQLARDEFIRRYRDPLIPVILTDATRDWPALRKFNFAFFQNQMGDREVIIGNRKYRLAEFIDILLVSTTEDPAPYPCKLNLREDFAELIPEVSPRFDLANPDRVGSPLVMKRFLDGLNDFEIFLGGPGGAFPYLHYDYLGLFAYINMIVGEKEFTLYSPDQEPYLYVNPEASWTSSIEDHHQPDLKRFPLFANTRPIKVVLKAGETLFIPSGWWHTARSLTPSISVAFAQLCSSNWSFFVGECCRQRQCRPLKALMARATLTAAGLLLGTMERLRGQR
jgi:histone arginine demethylase JMJD6